MGLVPVQLTSNSLPETQSRLKKRDHRLSQSKTIGFQFLIKEIIPEGLLFLSDEIINLDEKGSQTQPNQYRQ